jgi:hypothetical protein
MSSDIHFLEAPWAFYSFDGSDPFVDRSCFFCGLTPAGDIGRMDETKGFVQANCEPQCSNCTRMRQSITPDMCKRVTANHPED